MKKTALDNQRNPHRTFLDGTARSTAILETAAVGKGTYLPGWKWSDHVGTMTKKPSQRHIGYVISGAMMIENADGSQVEIGPGDAFEVEPGHDAWVLGDEPCVAIDFSVHPRK